MSDEDALREQNRSLCNALASMTERMYAVDQRLKTSVKIADEAQQLLMNLLLNTGPERMAIADRRVLIQVSERLIRIRKLK